MSIHVHRNEDKNEVNSWVAETRALTSEIRNSITPHYINLSTRYEEVRNMVDDDGKEKVDNLFHELFEAVINIPKAVGGKKSRRNRKNRKQRKTRRN